VARLYSTIEYIGSYQLKIKYKIDKNNVKFEEFLRDYDLKCKPCMPYRPETKGKTETSNALFI